MFGHTLQRIRSGPEPLTPKQAASAEAEIRKTLRNFPGVSASVETFLAERVEETLSGYTSAVVVNIFENDLGALDAEAREVSAEPPIMFGSAPKEPSHRFSLNMTTGGAPAQST